MDAIKTKSKRNQFVEETLSKDAVSEILDVEGVQMMAEWIASEAEKFRTNKESSSYEDFIGAFRTRFKDCSSHLLFLGSMISGTDPLRWQYLIDEILDDYLDRIVVARRKGDREKLAEDIHNFISMVVFFCALPAHVGLAHQQAAHKSRKKRSEALESRNKEIRKYAEWRMKAMTPLTSKAKLYDDIRGHSGLALSDRQLRKILKG